MIGFCFTLGICSCDTTVYKVPIDKIPYSAAELKYLKSTMEEVDSIFSVLNQ